MLEHIVTVSQTLFKCSCVHANIIHDRARVVCFFEQLQLTMPLSCGLFFLAICALCLVIIDLTLFMRQ
jgi:hypothetical protein